MQAFISKNKVLRMKTKCVYDTPSSELLSKAKELSVHQLIAYHSLLTTHKSIFKKRPVYISDKFKVNRTQDQIGPSRHINTVNISGKLTISQSGFMVRSGRLWNQLPVDVRQTECYNSFKSKIKKWISSNIKVRPNK